jgi:hypothetical protein
VRFSEQLRTLLHLTKFRPTITITVNHAQLLVYHHVSTRCTSSLSIGSEINLISDQSLLLGGQQHNIRSQQHQQHQ